MPTNAPWMEVNVSSNDWDDLGDGGDEAAPKGADGWVETTTERAERGPSLDLDPDDAPPAPRHDTEPVEPEPASDEWDESKTMAVLAHMSILFGIPVFLVPMLLRNDPLSYHHAKAAAATFGLFYVGLALSFVSCGLFMPVVMMLYIPALVGIARAVQGREAGTWGLGDLGEHVIPGSIDRSNT